MKVNCIRGLGDLHLPTLTRSNPVSYCVVIENFIDESSSDKTWLTFIQLDLHPSIIFYLVASKHKVHFSLTQDMQ